VLAHLGSQPPEKVSDILSVEGASNLVHLEVASTELGDGCKDRNILLAAPFMWKLLWLTPWRPGSTIEGVRGEDGGVQLKDVVFEPRKPLDGCLC
jgi:hypothetical protein